MPTVLIVDDDQKLLKMLQRTLVYENLNVLTATNGVDALHLVDVRKPDLLIVDWMMPQMDGLTLIRHLREEDNQTLVLMLTARDAIENRVDGLESGADDYLVKPFAIEELRARMRALLRRDAEDKSGCLAVADLVLDPATHMVTRNGHTIDLTAKEFSLLEYLMRNPNWLITREMAESHVWSYDYDGASNVVDVYIRRLRRKVDDPFKVKLIETIRGNGYKLRKPDD